MRLYRLLPERVAALLFQDRNLKAFRQHGVSRVLIRRASQLRDEHLQILTQALLPKPAMLVMLFKRLAPARRGQILQALVSTKQ